MALLPDNDNLFDRTWSASCPIRPRHGAVRRWGGIIGVALLTLLIVGYAVVTDSGRVRGQAEAYLGRLVGGPVHVERASLSLFEGLRLEGVTVRTPPRENAGDAGDAEPDQPIFSARSVQIDYDPLQLLAGRIEATRVVAVDPHVRLVEDVGDESWNFQRLRRRQGNGKFTPPEQLPEILLRNAQLDYARRFGPALLPRGTVGVEAQLTPDLGKSAGNYHFAVQTRGLSLDPETPGPRAGGTLDLRDGIVDARLDDVDFAALLDVLPRAVSELWRRQGITGRLDVPQLKVDWSRRVALKTFDGRIEQVPPFRMAVRLTDATVQGLPEQWLPPEEVAARRWMIRKLTDWRAMTERPALDHAAGEVVDALVLRPIKLIGVRGGFVFDDNGVSINGLVGDLEGNRLRIDGVVGGYSRDAAVGVVVQNADDAITVPRELAYVSSLPRQVREVYDRFLPTGKARLRLELQRPASPDGKPVRPLITGHVDILDGTFALDRFPYPVRNAKGRLIIGYDDAKQQDQLTLENVGGNGIAGGPNADAEMVVNGLIAPLNSVAGFDITVTGKGIRHEPAMEAALPPEARHALEQFDPSRHGKGIDYAGTGPAPPLDFSGNFIAQVNRPPGRDQHWDFRVDLFFDKLDGALAGFPYPIQGAAAEIGVYPDHVQVVRASMKRPVPAELGGGVASVGVAGRADWGKRPGDPDDLTNRPLRVDLSILGEGIPSGPAMWAALPESAAGELRSLGVGGVARTLAARVYTDADDKLQYDVTLDLTRGNFWPSSGTFNLSDVAGRVRILPDKVLFSGVTGRRGEASVKVDGTVELADAGRSDLSVTATNLTLDSALYELLPTAAQDAWDFLRPAGATDLTAAFAGPTSVLAGQKSAATTRPGEEIVYDVTLRPRGLSARADAFPYDLQNIRGVIRVTPQRVTLGNVTAEHALAATPERPARLFVSGTGDFGAGPGGGDVWKVTPKLLDAPLDADLLAALPKGLSDTLTGVTASGRLSADFDVLRLTTQPPTPENAAKPLAPDALFKVSVRVADAAVDIGVPLAKLDGTLDVAGTYEKGELHELSGGFAAERFTASERPGSGLSGAFNLPPGGRELTIRDVAADVAGGRLGGDATLTFGETAAEASKFRVGVAVRGADVRKLLGEGGGKEADFGGELTARLDLEGVVGQTKKRRGRGEVLVEGKKLYDLPLVLGILQVTNLALPISQPFREATTSFTIDGPRVVFDAITLTAADMRMSGQGTMDFESQKVDLSFTTSNHGWAAIPLVGNLVGMARDELLRIHIRGTLQAPEVSAGTLPTFTSTIDEVFKGR